MKLADDHRDAGLRVLGVTDASVEAGLQMLDEEELPFALLADAGGAREAWQVAVIWGSPSFLVDVRGEVVAEEVLAGGAAGLAARLRR